MKECSLCGQETIPKQVMLPAAGWQCTMYFINKPERATVLYDKIEDAVKKRLLKAFMPEEEEIELNERKNSSRKVRRFMVRETGYRTFKSESGQEWPQQDSGQLDQ